MTTDCSWNYMFCACSFHVNSMNNLLSYCGLVDARISASEKDLPVNLELKNSIFTTIERSNIKMKDVRLYAYNANVEKGALKEYYIVLLRLLPKCF